MSQTLLTDTDLQLMMGIARDHNHDDGGVPLPWSLLHDLTRLVECDALSVSGQDTPRWEIFAAQELPEEEQLHAPEQIGIDDVYRQHYWGSTCSYPDRTGDIVTVTRTSDLQAEREFCRSPMYLDYLGPAGLEHDAMVCLDAGTPQRTLRLLFWRGSGSDFSDRDVAVLTLLRPHLQAAYQAAEWRRHRPLPLTQRQHQILRHVAAGYTNARIARQLEVSEATVRKHMENIFDRLDVTSRAAAISQMRVLS